jgi:hypothetical protein
MFDHRHDTDDYDDDDDDDTREAAREAAFAAMAKAAAVLEAPRYEIPDCVAAARVAEPVPAVFSDSLDAGAGDASNAGNAGAWAAWTRKLIDAKVRKAIAAAVDAIVAGVGQALKAQTHADRLRFLECERRCGELEHQLRELEFRLAAVEGGPPA